MDNFYERLIVRAATIDEILSDGFEVLPGQKGDSDIAAERLAAWCRSCSSGDWSLFNQRLNRDGLSIDQVLAKFATVRRVASASTPQWINDAIWIEAALRSRSKGTLTAHFPGPPCAFEHLFASLVEHADVQLQKGIEARALDNLNKSARSCLRHSLLKELSSLATPAIYERFVKARNADLAPDMGAQPTRDGSSRYDRFIADMKAGGLRRLFEDKPVLLRLIASITRQWIDTSREFVLRLDADLATIRRGILNSSAHSRIAMIEGELSDPHDNGHSVLIVHFEDGTRVVYKPKDVRLDVAWYNLVKRLNLADPPVTLKAVRTISRDGYGWTEFIDHTGCVDREGFKWFFERAGAWLALFHCFASSDMHLENMIAAGDHPVPIDLETILRASSEERKARDLEGLAFEAAMETVANSVSTVGLLPAYDRSPDNNIFPIGGLNSDEISRTKLGWSNINSDTMRPCKSTAVNNVMPNIPYVDGNYAKFGDHIDSFVSGFENYANFLLRWSRGTRKRSLFYGFAGLPVRKVIRPSRFYYMLLQRLKDHRNMVDGVAWSAQIEFIARLTDWDNDTDLIWPLQQAERSALAVLNVPHFVMPSDGCEISDATGILTHTKATSGIDRARARFKEFDKQDIAWQIEVINQNTSFTSTSSKRAVQDTYLKRSLRSVASDDPPHEVFIIEAGNIANELNRYAIRRGPGAAWIGIDWLGDTEISELAPLGPDIYNGVSGIAIFLSAHAAVTGCKASGEIALAGIAGLRKNLNSRNAARLARSLGLGGATGLGSIVYALTVMSKCLDEKELLADAHVAADLFTDDLIAADKQLDVMGGSAGGILSLLRLYRDTQSSDVLKRAIKCGEHLLGHPRTGPEGRRCWSGQGSGQRVLNGMSHGASGFAYALASLSVETAREEFARAAEECIAFENSSYDAERNSWPDLRGHAEPSWSCQWCHGPPGIGLARIATVKQGGLDSKRMITDIQNALGGVERGWPVAVDTLCCGTLGSIEFLNEASSILDRSSLSDLASQRLMTVLQTALSNGDYRWNTGKRRFNLGLFRGLAGVGYTLLRQVDGSLPNVTIWE